MTGGNDPNDDASKVIRVVATDNQLPKEEDRIAIDFGREVYKNSLAVGRDFCKSMIEASFGALGLYYALYAFMLPDTFRPESQVLGLSAVNAMLAPAAAFLVAAVVATAGYAPVSANVSLSILDGKSADGVLGISDFRKKIISRRRWAARISFAAFVLGFFFAAWVVRGFAIEATTAAAAPPDDAARYAIVETGDNVVVCGRLISSVPMVLEIEPDVEPMRLVGVQGVHLVDTCP